jgi:type I restriction enzyme S subunit
MGAGRWVGGEFAFVTPEKAASLSSNLAVPGDLVFTQRGTLGQVALVPDGAFAQYVVSQSQMKLTVDKRKASARFLYYVFSSAEQREHIHNNAIQTGVPHTNLGILRNTPLLLPPPRIQDAISDVLGTLDEKIELNQRMNETLEAITRALFKSWFVDFDPVRAKAARRKPSGLDAETANLFPSEFVDSEFGPIPKGWSIEPLDAIADFRNGLALQNFRPADGDERLPVVKIAQLRTGEADSGEWARADIPTDCIMQNGDVVFSWSGSLTAVLWSGGQAALNQHLFRVTSRTHPKWFYFQWLLLHLPEFQQIARDKATTMGHIQRHHLSAARCVVPPAALVDRATEVFAPLLDQRIKSALEARTLSHTRDALLPRLLSGELSVAP